MVRIADAPGAAPERWRARYDELYAVYRELYPATADLLHRLADVADGCADADRSAPTDG